MADAKPYSDEEIKAKGIFWTGKASGLLSNHTIAFMTGKKADDPDVEIDLSRIFATIADQTAVIERLRGEMAEAQETIRKAHGPPDKDACCETCYILEQLDKWIQALDERSE